MANRINFDRAAGDPERRRLLAQARRIRFEFTYPLQPSAHRAMVA